MVRRLLVNDILSALPEHRTFWNDLQDWFAMDFCGGSFQEDGSQPGRYGVPWSLDKTADNRARACDGSCQSADHDEHETRPCSLIIRNASYFGPMRASETIPTISLLQDIMDGGPMLDQQMRVLIASKAVVFNSEFTKSHYHSEREEMWKVIPLPVDFSLFEPQNAMGCQQALGLPDGCICWVGATQGPAGHIKGFDIFLKIVRMNPDLHFVGVFKDAIPDSFPPNLRCFLRLSHEELVKVIGACRVGLCTSRMESQHLAGIEMGGCGLKLVVPDTGVYWKREDLPIWRVTDPTPQAYAASIRAVLAESSFNEHVRGLWKKEFDRPVIRAQWEKLIQEVECSGQS